MIYLIATDFGPLKLLWLAFNVYTSTIVVLYVVGGLFGAKIQVQRLNYLWFTVPLCVALTEITCFWLLGRF